jgi:outer membrane receptor protein involved in Fe transport
MASASTGNQGKESSSLNHPTSLAAAMCVVALMPARHASAQQLDEIIVTAQRRNQQLSDVPISVTAYSQEDSDRRGLITFEDVARVTPNLTLNNLGTTIARVAIRSVDSSAGSGTTGLYVNDVPIQVRQIGFNAFDVFPQIFDLERVEVLRGPQGTLFGAGSQGGTVRFITPEPDLGEFTGYNRADLSTTQSGDPSYEIGAAFGGPIVKDRLAFRASAWYRRDGGFVDRVRESETTPGTLEVVDKNSDSIENYIGRFDLKWALAENVVITPSFYYQKQDFNDRSVLWIEDTGPAPLSASFAGAYTAPLTFSDFGAGEFRNGDPTQQVGEDRFFLPSIKAEWDAGSVTLTAVASYFDRKQILADDFTTFDQVLFTGIVNSGLGIIPPVSPFGFSRPVLPGQNASSFDVNEQENRTFEARLQSNPDQFERLDWQFGVFYSENEQTAVQQVEDLFLGQVLDTQFQDLFGFGLGPDPILGFFGIPLVDGRFIFDNLEVASDRQLAGFTQIDYEIIDRLTLTAGVRVSETEFSIFNEVVGPVLGPFNTDSVTRKETPITPKFAASWQPTDDDLFYASASKGFRIGGANAAVGLPCGVGGDGNGNPAPGTALGAQGLIDRPLSFDSDNLWSYEVGAKNRLFDGVLSTDIAIFHIDWSDIQQNIQLPACGFRYFNNVGSADIDGAEMTVTLTPAEGFTLSAAFGYTDARFSETAFATPAAEAAGALPLVSKGDKLGGPPWTLNLVAEYRFTGPRNIPLSILVDWGHIDSETGRTAASNPANGGFDPNFTPPPKTDLVNLRLGAEFVEGLEMTLFLNNLLDSSPLLNRFIQPAGTLARGQTFRPRTVGVRAIYRF